MPKATTLASMIFFMMDVWDDEGIGVEVNGGCHRHYYCCEAVCTLDS